MVEQRNFARPLDFPDLVYYTIDVKGNNKNKKEYKMENGHKLRLEFFPQSLRIEISCNSNIDTRIVSMQCVCSGATLLDCLDRPISSLDKINGATIILREANKGNRVSYPLTAEDYEDLISIRDEVLKLDIIDSNEITRICALNSSGIKSEDGKLYITLVDFWQECVIST